MVETSQAVGVEDQQMSVLDVAGSPLLAPEETPSRPAVPLRELRLALVCYGGVSLAIYMHGITKELEKLVAASVAYERDQDAHDFGASDTASVYWSQLKRLEAGSGVRTRVVVDVVSGTSAGGINGVFLAAAIARNRSQEPLRTMWLEEGDIKRLLVGPARGPFVLKLPHVVAAVLRGRPVLDGSRISRLLREALTTMAEERYRIVDEVGSLLAPQQRLQLFVPVTDFFGYDVRIPADDPAWVRDRTHRHVLHFIHDPREPALDQLAPRWDDALAFSARATSSFPGAFPPVSIADYERSVPDPRFEPAQRDALFASYRLNGGADPEKTHFVDGGVLDNAPFATTIAAIKLRPAATEVDRRLIYVEPDPTTEPGGSPVGRAPGLVQTIVGGFAGIPRQEPIIGDLIDLAVHNTNVAKIRDVIETSFEPMRRRVRSEVGDGRGLDEPLDVAEVTAWRLALSEQAVSDAGFSYPTYLRLRIRAVIDDFAQLVADRRGYPPTSAHALFVGRILRRWAEAQQLLDKAAAGTDAQRELIQTLDMAHHERHVRFLIAAMSWWYGPPDDEARVPERQQLDRAKQALYAQLGELHDLAKLLTDDERIVTLVDRLFGPAVVADALDAPLDRFVTERAAELTELQGLVSTAVSARLVALPALLDAEVVRITASWTGWARWELLTRHLGFAHWDVITYPVEAASGVNERDHVEVMRISPHEATLLASAAEKDLEGGRLGHFGAFFSRPGRENDYLWGRLDGMERLLVLLATPPGHPTGWARAGADGDAADRGRRTRLAADARRGARLIVASERGALGQIAGRLDFVHHRASPAE